MNMNYNLFHLIYIYIFYVFCFGVPTCVSLGDIDTCFLKRKHLNQPEVLTKADVFPQSSALLMLVSVSLPTNGLVSLVL